MPRPHMSVAAAYREGVQTLPDPLLVLSGSSYW
jgi:hypothetical protein